MANAYSQYSDYLFAKAAARGLPLSGTFELTARCNLDCRMCYIHKRESDAGALLREKPAAYWLKLAEVCARAGMLNLLLTGGEPTLRPDFKEIYTGCRRLGLMVAVNTNGTVLDGDMLAFLASDPPARMNITLYGASRETYGALCGDPGAYDRAIHNILALREWGVAVKLNYSITPYNRADMAEVLSFAREHDLPIQAVSYMFPPVRACEQGLCQAERMSARESARAQVEYDRLRFPPEVCEKRWENLLKGIREPGEGDCQEAPAERINCRAGLCTFWMTWDGKLRPCGMMTVPSVDTGEPEQFPEAWKRLRALREEILFPAKCTGCADRAACDMCPAICYAETGSFTEAPDYMCQRTEAYLALLRENLKK